LREEIGRIYWCFLDFEKAFDSLDREALWFKMRRIGVSENMLNCKRIMYESANFCVKCGENEVTTFAPQTNYNITIYDKDFEGVSTFRYLGTSVIITR
jgi:hypothetical protein